MADGIGGILTQKIGPIPLWGWLAGGGAAIWLVASGKLGSLTGSGTTTTTSAQTAAGQATAAEAGAQQAAANASGQSAGAQLQQELGLLQQLQSFNQQSYENNLQQVQQTQQTSSALNPSVTSPSVTVRAPATTGPTVGYDQNHPGVPIFSSPGGPQIGTVPFGSSVGTTGPSVQGPGNLGSNAWWPVSYAGQTGYLSGYDVSGVASSSTGIIGAGGASRLPPLLGKGGAGVGTVPAMWRGGHKLVRAGGAGPLYPHYAMGGPRNVMQIGALAHVHPARVMAANGLVKKGQATPGQIVRVA